MKGDEENVTWRTNDEKEAWEKAKECFGASRILFEGYGDELGFDNAEYYEIRGEESLTYYLNGKYIFIKIKKLTKERKLQNLVDGNLKEEYQFEGDETSYVRLYEVEHEKNKVDGYAEIVYGKVQYLIVSEVLYDEFESFIKSISFRVE